jgi:aminoglycoside phosphotransferase (APT) family kinase protein
MELDAVRGAFWARGLSRPFRMAPLGRPSRYGAWRLIADPHSDVDELWMRATPAARLRTELAALSMASSASLAVPQALYLDHHGLPSPVVVHAPVDGVDGAQVILNDPSRRPEVYCCIGRVVKALSRIESSCWGRSSADGRAFLPAYPSWRLEWEAHLRLLFARAFGLGPMLHSVKAALAERLPALDGVSRFTLVHGDLVPACVILDEEEKNLHIAGILDWSEACCGDPLIDLAALIQERDTPSRGAALRAAGYSEADFEDPAVLARVEVYYLTRQLWLAGGFGPRFCADGRDEAGRLARAQQAIEETLHGGLRHRVASGFKGDGTVEASPDIVHMHLRRILSVASLEPPLAAMNCPTFVGSLGAAFLAVRMPLKAAQCTSLADRIADRLGRRWERSQHVPVVDRGKWRTEEARRVLQRHLDAKAEPSLSLPTLWLTLRGLDEIQDALCDGVLGGISAHLASLIWVETNRTERMDAQSILMFGLLCEAALFELPTLVDGLPDLTSARARMRSVAHAAFSTLELPRTPQYTHTGLESTIVWLLDEASPTGEHDILPAYLCALDVLLRRSHLPGAPDVLLAATGFLLQG